MTEAALDSEYFKEKILSLRQKLHAMEGFEAIENISENVPKSKEATSIAFSSGKEKKDYEK